MVDETYASTSPTEPETAPTQDTLASAGDWEGDEAPPTKRPAHTVSADGGGTNETSSRDSTATTQNDSDDINIKSPSPTNVMDVESTTKRKRRRQQRDLEIPDGFFVYNTTGKVSRIIYDSDEMQAVFSMALGALEEQDRMSMAAVVSVVPSTIAM